jgi:transposase-like protein
LVGDEPAMRDWAAELVERARTDGVELTGENGLLTALVRQVLQTGLEVELADHLGYEPHAVAGRGAGNSRNGSYPKTVSTDIGKVDPRVPRDRNGSFDPVTVAKGQRRLAGLSVNVISLYAKGMTTGDIQAYLFDIYGTEISRDTISRITDAVVEDLIAWQNRPLDRIYPVVLIGAIVVKIRDGQVANRPVYVVMGVNLDGERDVLGLWVGPAGEEGAKFWMAVLTELRNRGVGDCFIVCCDGLKGLPDAIRHLAPSRRPNLRRPPGPVRSALPVQEALGTGVPGDARDLHRSHRRRRRGPFRRVRRDLSRAVSGHDRHVAASVG